MHRLREKTVALLLGLIFAASALSSVSAKEQEYLSRSLYVPIHFAVAPELAGKLRVWIAGDGTELGVSPHTFMFTLFPGKGDEFLPSHVEVRLEAEAACDGKDFTANFVVTPFGIHGNKSSHNFSMDDLGKQARLRKRDLRVPSKLVRVRCPADDSAPFAVDDSTASEQIHVADPDQAKPSSDPKPF